MTSGARQSGVTLIELMVSVVLVSVLIIGVSTTWVWLGDAVFQTTLRQKAVFALNAEMERLVGLFRFSDFATSEGGGLSTSGYSATVAGLSGLPTDRRIYPDTVSVTTDAATVAQGFVTTDTSSGGIAAFLAAPGQVLSFPAGTSTTKRNAILLDEKRDITAQLSWTLTTLGNTSQCYSSQSCYLLTLYLEYPYRLAGTAPLTPIPGQPVQAITLMTVVGRYR